MATKLKTGDLVKFVKHVGDSTNAGLAIGVTYQITSELSPDTGRWHYRINSGKEDWWVHKDCIKPLKEESNMVDSIKEYVKENRSILMTIAVALLVDHLVFQGAFREKVKSIIDSMLNGAQKKLDKTE